MSLSEPIKYEGMVFRPPSEAYSLIVQSTIGCTNNKCTFCSMYMGKKFRVRSMEDIKNDLVAARAYYRGVQRIFFADGDSLFMKTEDLAELLDFSHKLMPELERVSVYGSPQAILRKSPEDLKLLGDKGLKIIYMGLETGDDRLLGEVCKGVTSAEMIEAGQKVMSSPIELSVTVLLGLAGADPQRSLEHARATGEVLSHMSPTYVGALSLMLVPGTPLYKQHRKGEFKLPDAMGMLSELRAMIENINVKRECIFRTNHASNYLPLKGTLPQDKEALIKTIDHAVAHPEILRPEEYRAL